MKRIVLLLSLLLAVSASAQSPTISEVSTDKIVYRPGEKAALEIQVKNSGAASRVTLQVDLVTGIDTVKPLFNGPLDVTANGQTAWKSTLDTTGMRWGAEIRARLQSGGEAITKKAYFGVASNIWSLAIMSAYPKWFTEFETPDKAHEGAKALRARGFTGIESFFWAPDDFLDFTPDTERFVGGQGAYPSSVTGTKNIIAALHEQGMAATVYANMWGGSGAPALEWQRRRPELFGGANFNTFVLDDMELMPAGIVKAPGAMWNFNQIALINTDPLMQIHAHELVESRKLFGWDAVRYDSYYTQPWAIRSTKLVRSIVEKESPGMQFGYNSIVPDDYRRSALDTMLSNHGLVMTEDIRLQGGNDNLAKYLTRLLEWRELAWAYGGNVGSIYHPPGNATDDTLMTSLLLATGSHPYYNPIENKTGEHPAFALRFAEYIWHNRMRPLRDPDAVVQFGNNLDPLEWRRLVRTLTVNGNQRRLVLHLLNIPKGWNAGGRTEKTLAPMPETPLTIKLPNGAQNVSATVLSAVPTVDSRKLATTQEGGAVRLTIPVTQYWSTLVVDYTSPQPLPEAQNPKVLSDTYLQDWYVAGPFPGDLDFSTFEAQVPPEKSVDLQATYEGRDGPVTWKRYRAPGDPVQSSDVINMERSLNRNSNKQAMGYAYTRVVSDRDRDALLTITADDNFKVWLNGVQVAADKASHDRDLRLDATKVPVKIKRGTNEILVKVGQKWMDWEFLLRLAEPDGTPLTEGMTYEMP